MRLTVNFNGGGGARRSTKLVKVVRGCEVTAAWRSTDVSLATKSERGHMTYRGLGACVMILWNKVSARRPKKSKHNILTSVGRHYRVQLFGDERIKVVLMRRG
jgi:hypothetical protein